MVAKSAHEIDHRLIGSDIQVVEVTLDPQETVIAEAGAMTYMEDGVSFVTRMGDGSEERGLMGKIWSASKRALTGESVFLTHFTNEGNSAARVAFAPPHPGQVVAVDLAQQGGEIICQRDAFLCAAKGTQLDIAFSKKLRTGFFGGEGFILQRLHGDGMVFLHAGGTLIEKPMNGETLRVDTGCVVGFSSGIDYDIAAAGGLKSMLFSGEGMFLATLSGRGTVYLQSMPFSRLVERFAAHMPDQEG